QSHTCCPFTPARVLPSGAKATAEMSCLSPLNGSRSSPVATSHSLPSPTSLPLVPSARNLPLRSNATARTGQLGVTGGPVSGTPVAGSRHTTDRSASPAVTSLLPSGANATPATGPLCHPGQGRRSQVTTSQSHRDPSAHPVARVLPS